MLFSQCFEIDMCRWHLHNFSSVIHSKTLTEKSIMDKLFYVEYSSTRDADRQEGGVQGGKWSFALISVTK